MSNEETTKTITAFGTLERETKNSVRYATSLGVVYVPKSQLGKLTGSETTFPESIKITIAVQDA